MRESWAVALVVLCACALGPRPPASPPRHTSLDLGISTSTLANGLRVVLVRDPYAPEVQVTMRYRVGAIDDGATPGIAHLAEHLMFQQVLGSQTLFAQLEDITTYFNGETRYETTTYLSRAPVSSLDRLLSIEAVRMGLRCTSISDSVFVREREVVVNESRQRDDSLQLRDALHRAVYADGHPYRQVVGGDITSVSALTRDQVCAFVDAHYAPANAVLVVSGNITGPQLEVALGKFLARIAKRDVAPSKVVRPTARRGGRIQVPAPIDKDALLVSWSLPSDPRNRAQVNAVASALPGILSAQVAGRVTALQLGDEHDPSLALVVTPGEGEELSSVMHDVEGALRTLPDAFGESPVAQLDAIVFDRIRQSAIYRTYASLEDGGARDSRLAAYVLDGLDPRAALATEFESLRELRPEDTVRIAREYFSLEHATIATLEAAGGKKRGHDVVVRPEVHDLGQQRSVPDPADAHRAADHDATPTPRISDSLLSNGLRVVLVPSGSVPTVDIRLVFRSGTADESPEKRGVASVAAYGLDWNLRYLNDLLVFFAAGGVEDVSVDYDHTTFAVEGVDMHLDMLLAGLRRWVRDGTYPHHIDRLVTAALRANKSSADDSVALADAWRSAVYGEAHPYRRAGGRDIEPTLSAADVSAFREAHYTPANATLIISGRFDVDLAQKWAEYLFGDWKGQTYEPGLPQTRLQSASIALADDIAQMELRIALPVTVHDRAEQLVAAEMLSNIAEDVRHELGATYGLSGQLALSRADAHYEIGGWVDAERGAAAMQLINDRIAKLRQDPDSAARAFVTARTRVLVRLGSLVASGQLLGMHVEREVELGDKPMSDWETARQVRALTIDQMTAALGDLDLTRAVVLIRGPLDDLQKTYAVLGRTPTFVKVAPSGSSEGDVVAKPAATDDAGDESVKVEPALTSRDARMGVSLQITPSFVAAHVALEAPSAVQMFCCTGAGATVELGWHLESHKTVGFHAGIGVLSGYYRATFDDRHVVMNVVPIDLGPFFQLSAGPLWGSAYLGVHIDRIDADGSGYYESPSGWYPAMGGGLLGGVDVLRFGPHRIGFSGQVEGELASDTGYGAFRLGLTYRQ